MYSRIVEGRRECIGCGSLLPVSEFPAYQYRTKQGRTSVRLDPRCRACNRHRISERRTDRDRREIDRVTSLEWKRANRERLAKTIRERQRSDAAYRAKKAALQRARKARMRAGLGPGRNDPAILAIYDEAKMLQRKLEACVECDDPLEIVMHVDHIIPLSAGGPHAAENLQILSARANLAKGASCPK